MLNTAVRNTKKLIREKSGEENIRIGRFFTKKETARRMAQMLSPISGRVSVSVLDAGAGTGILSAVAVETVCRMGGAAEVRLTCYETDAACLPMLRVNLERIRRIARHDYGVKVIYEVREENFLLSSPEDTLSPAGYDIVLMNPPSELLPPDSPESAAHSDLVSGEVDMAYLFVVTAARRLAQDGQMVTMLPLVSATAVSLEKLRSILFDTAFPVAIHLFSRAGGKEKLKKQYLLALRRIDTAPETIALSVSGDDGTDEKTTHFEPLPYDLIVSKEDRSLLLFADEDDLLIYRYMRGLPHTIASYGLKIRTGLTLTSRYPDALRDRPEEGAYPLLHPASLQDGQIVFPVPHLAHQYIIPPTKSLLQKNRNLLLIKRVPAKSDRRRLMCAPHLAATMNTPYISTHNKLDYIDVDGEGQMDAAFLLGLHGFLSSEIMDRYVRICSKSSQINAKELGELPLPEAKDLRAIGEYLMVVRVYHQEICDRAVKSVLFSK